MKTNAAPPIDPARIAQIIGLIRGALGWALAFMATFEACLPKRWLRKRLILARFIVASLVMVRAAQNGARQRHPRHRVFHNQIIEQGGIRRRVIGSALRKALSTRGLKAGYLKLLEALDQLEALAAAFARRLSRAPHRRFVFPSTSLAAFFSNFKSQSRSPELVEGSAAPPFT